MREYTLTEAVQLKLFKKPNGQPYTCKGSLAEKLKAMGFSRTGFSEKNRPMFQFTEENIDAINHLIRAEAMQKIS